MKAEIGRHGELIITPSTKTEEFALKHWLEVSSIPMILGAGTMESFHIRGSKMLFCETPTPEGV